MPTTAGVGKSLSASAELAGREAARAASESLAGHEPDFCLVFGTSGYNQAELLRGIRSVTGKARISGCSGEGIIAGGDSEERDRAVGVLAIRSDAFVFEPLLAMGYTADPDRCGRELAAGAAAADDAIGLLVFPDGLVGNCTELLEAIHRNLPRPIPVIGGSAGDAMLFERTWQYRDDEAACDAVAAVLIRGRGELVYQVSHGCQTVGLERTVTRADGGWMREIDGRPAWAVFREYLDGEPEDLNAEGMAHLSLAERLGPDGRGDYGEFIIRIPLHLDQESGSLFFPGGGIAAGTPVRFARRDPTSIRTSARACASRIAGHRGGRAPDFILQFDCAGRGRILFGSCVAEEIVRPLQEIIGAGVPWIGFHTYGEIAPIQGRARYHNYTVALCALFEGD